MVKVEIQKKTTTVDIENAIRVGADFTNVLTFRAMTAGDLRIFDINKGQVDAMLQLCAKLSVPEMLPGQADKLTLDDWQRVQGVLTDFLKPSAPPTQEPAAS